MGPDALHPDAPHHLPFFITAPGATDTLMVASGLFLLTALIGVGVLYFKLHALPEQMAHKGQKVQFELVAVLALLALFTHNHAFWIAGLLLALLPLPDFTTPLRTIASSLEAIASKPAQQAQGPRDDAAGAEPDHQPQQSAQHAVATEPSPGHGDQLRS
jgi:hypothetical protein